MHIFFSFCNHVNSHCPGIASERKPSCLMVTTHIISPRPAPLAISSNENTKVSTLFIQDCFCSCSHFVAERDKSDEAHRGRKHSHSYLAEEPEKRAKRQYIKKSSKWNSLAKSSHLREERFLRVQKPDITIRPTATRYDPSRYHPFHICDIIQNPHFYSA